MLFFTESSCSYACVNSGGHAARSHKDGSACTCITARSSLPTYAVYDGPAHTHARASPVVVRSGARHDVGRYARAADAQQPHCSHSVGNGRRDTSIPTGPDPGTW